jgi:hypothetical protein
MWTTLTNTIEREMRNLVTVPVNAEHITLIPALEAIASKLQLVAAPLKTSHQQQLVVR